MRLLLIHFTVQIFKCLTVETDLYSYELTSVSEYKELPIFIYTCFNKYPYPLELLLLVSIATHLTSMPGTRGGLFGWNIYI